MRLRIRSLTSCLHICKLYFRYLRYKGKFFLAGFIDEEGIKKQNFAYVHSSTRNRLTQIGLEETHVEENSYCFMTYMYNFSSK